MWGEGWLQQVLCFRAGNKTVGLDLEKRMEGSAVSLPVSLVEWTVDSQGVPVGVADCDKAMRRIKEHWRGRSV